MGRAEKKKRVAIAKYGNERAERKELVWQRENQWEQPETAMCGGQK